jgi:hypothetical protein
MADVTNTPVARQTYAHYYTVEAPGRIPILLLRVFAWIHLAASLFMVYIIESALLSQSELGVSISVPATAHLVPFAVFLQGVFICTLFMVLASIADNVRAMRKNSDSQLISRT